MNIMEYIEHYNCFAKKSHVYCIGMTSMSIELVCRYRGIAPGRFAEEMMMMALFGRVHINMHMTMVDYICIVAHDGPVPVAYNY